MALDLIGEIGLTHLPSISFTSWALLSNGTVVRIKPTSQACGTPAWETCLLYLETPRSFQSPFFDKAKPLLGSCIPCLLDPCPFLSLINVPTNQSSTTMPIRTVGNVTQDWEPVVLNRRKPKGADIKDPKAVNQAIRAGAGAAVETMKKFDGGSNKEA